MSKALGKGEARVEAGGREPAGDAYRIADLVDIDALARIFERFSAATGLAVGLVSYPEQELLIAYGMREVCRDYHRAFAESEKRCLVASGSLTRHSGQPRQPGAGQFPERKGDAVDPAGLTQSEERSVDTATVPPSESRNVDSIEPVSFITSEGRGFDTVDTVTQSDSQKRDSIEPVTITQTDSQKLDSIEPVTITQSQSGMVDGDGISRCENGLVDAIIPVMIHGRHVASLLAGQVFFDKPDTERFQEMATKYGFDMEAYLEAIDRVPIVSEDQFRKSISFLAEMASMIAEMGLSNLETRGKDRQIRERERYLTDIFDSVQDGIGILDRDLTVRRVNGVMRQWYARNLPLEGKKCYQCYHDADEPCDPCPTLRCIETGRLEREIVPGLPGSAVEWVELYSYPMKDQHTGEVTGVVELVRDITERKRAERRLQDSEEKHRSLVESASSAIVYMDTEGTFVLANSRAAEFMGIDRDQFVGKSLFDLLPYEQARSYWEVLETRLREQKGAALEDYIELPGGNYWFLSTVSPVEDAQGRKVGIQMIVTDITDRKRAEDELYRLRDLLGNIVNYMPSVLIGVDDEGRVTQWNREAERATGLPAADAQGRPLTDVFPALAPQMEKARAAMHKGDAIKAEKVSLVLNGDARLVDLTVYPLLTNGNGGAVIRVDDVTERVRIEEMMMQSEKMLSVGGLAAGMAHELNNPLAGVLQSLQVMRNRLSRDMPQNRSAAVECGTSLDVIESYMERRGVFSMMEAAEESGRRAVEIINNVLSFSRPDAGRFEPADLGDLLDRTLELASSEYDPATKYDFRRIEIVKEYHPAMPQVWCEAGKIQQVFFNILKNGAQAMAEATHRNDGPPRFTLRLMPEGKSARVEIEDTGPGIEAEVRRRVFEPFFTTKGVGVGTGLGLSVSYFIVTEDHGGTLTVESAPGKGAKFIVRLPIERPSQP